MADWSDISDLWWLQPRGQARDSVRGLAAGAQIAQNRDENQWRQQQSQLLMEQKRAQLQSQEAKMRGIAAMSAHLSDVAARNAWLDPKEEAKFLALGAQFPQAFDDPFMAQAGSNFERAKTRALQAEKSLGQLDISQQRVEIAKERLGFEQERIDIAQQMADAAMMRAETFKERSEPEIVEKEVAGKKRHFLRMGNTIKEVRTDDLVDIEGQLYLKSEAGGYTRVPKPGEKIAPADRLRYQNEVKALQNDYLMGRLKDAEGKKITPTEFKKRLDELGDRLLGTGEATPAAPAIRSLGSPGAQVAPPPANPVGPVLPAALAPATTNQVFDFVPGKGLVPRK